jgi:methyl-accepting chemotaxis protein
MADCERLATCPFFKGQLKQMPAVASLIRETYCFGDKTKCARYQLVVAGIPVPGDLLPNDVRRARQLLGRREK